MTTLPPAAETKGTSAAPFLTSSMIMEGFGGKGAKPRPFNFHLSVRQFQSWVAAAIKLNSNAAAGVPLRLYVRAGKGGRRKLFGTRPVGRRAKAYFNGDQAHAGGAGRPSAAVMGKVAAFGGDIEEVTEMHPAMAVLSRPNDDDSGHEITKARFNDLQLCGNAYQYVVDSRLGVPSMLYRMPPQWTTIVPNTSGRGTRRVAGYVYGRQGTAGEQKFGVDEVIHFKEFSPTDLHYGRGWVEDAWTAISLHNSKRTEDLAFKDNMSRPDWMLTIKSGGNAEGLKRLQQAVNEQFRGAENTGKFLVGLGDIAATALQWEPKELGTPENIIEEIAATSGVPVTMLKTNDPTKASSTTARLGWYRSTIRPMCMADEQALNLNYLSRFDGADDMFLAYDHVSFEDEAEVTRRVVGLVSGGILSPNEARQELGYNSAGGADFLFPPAGNTGGSAAVMGDLSAEQNDERPQVRAMAMPAAKAIKGVTRMPVEDAEAARTEFLRETFLTFLRDGTVGDVLANQTDLRALGEAVGVPIAKDAPSEPYLPVVAAPGPIVNGGVIRDDAGDIVGGDVNPVAAAESSKPKPGNQGEGERKDDDDKE